MLRDMFVRYFLELSSPFEEVEARLLSSPRDWVPGLARDAEDRAATLMTEVGFGPQDGLLRKQIEIHVGEPVRMASRTFVPMAWEATGPRVLFPAFSADVEVAGLGPRRTQLSISARYDPPLGAVGRALDRALLHRVAEATVKDFLDRVGERLAAERAPAR